MSRNIEEKNAVRISEAEAAMKKTDDGKLIFTRYREKLGVFLFIKEKLTVAVFPEDSQVGGIYIAKVKSIVPNINACFVELQPGSICFLPMKDTQFPFLLNRAYDGRILEGDELPVQIVRDAQKTKQPSVTAHISLSDDYFALTLGSPKVGFSNKLSREQKATLAERLTEAGIIEEGCLVQNHVLPGMPSVGLILRTKAAELTESAAELTAEYFGHFWDECMTFFHTAAHRTCFSCLKKTDAVDGMMTGLLSGLVAAEEFSELLTDDPQIYDRLREYLAKHMPEKKLRLYEDSLLSLSKLYSLESRVREGLEERVWLKSGGYLVIQPTEALTVIDVNSGKFEGRKAAMALKLNLEASAEIARQLRLRNLSGIIIVDFINMEEEESRTEVVSCLRRHVGQDKVKTVVVDMTPLGLVEITRKRITRPLKETLGCYSQPIFRERF